MAKTISDENIRLNIIINGNAAQKELLDLEKNTREYTKANKELTAAKAKLASEGKKNTQEYKNLSAEIKANNTVITQNKARMEALQKEIGITGLTMQQLINKSKLLKLQLLNAIPGSEAHTRYTNELRQIQNRLGELSGRAASTKMSLSSLADGFNKYAALGATVIATTTGIIFSLQKMIDYNGKLSDAQADVMKTTGLTKIEVDELTKSFGALETRTSRIDLLKIAEEGGRIGILKDDIGAFVEVMNKANVALGDSFTGGVEEVASKLGKLKLLFNDTKNIGVDQAYNAIGSAINELGANGVATESNIANFATRVGSLPDAIKPSISQALALGAAFEESGIEAEISGRAYNIFLKQAATDADKFAKVMGVTTAEVENMINTNPVDFFLQFSEGLKGMDATETAKTLNYLGINAEGANKIVGAAGNNVGRFRELLELSNKSMIDATSLTNEYNIKNNNLAATLEKIKKTTMGWFSSEGLIAWLEVAVVWFAKVIGATGETDKKTSAWKETLVFTAKMVAVVTAALITNVAWQKLVALWTTRSAEGNLLYTIGLKARAFAEGVGTIATQAYAIATMLATGKVVGATKAFRILTATMMTTPWGFILSAVAAIGAAYVVFSDSAREAATKQSLLNDAIKETSTNLAAEKTNLELLLKIARDETQSKEERLRAVAELNRLVPGYNNNLTIESANTLDATDKINKYIESIERAAKAKYFKSLIDKKSEELAAAENSNLEENIDWLDRTWNAMKTGGQFFAMERANVETAIKNKTKLIDITKEELKNATELYQSQLKINNPNEINDLKAIISQKENLLKIEQKNLEGLKYSSDIFGGLYEVDAKKTQQKIEGLKEEIKLNKELLDSKTDKNPKKEEEETTIFTPTSTGDKSFETTEKQLTEFITKQQAERSMAHQSALDKELAQIDEKYRTELEKAAGHEELKKELENLKAQEKEDLILQRTVEFEAKKKELQNQIDLQNATDEEIAEQLKLAQNLEKELAELDKLKFTEEQKADIKLKILEKYNKDVDKLLDKAAFDRLKKQQQANKTEINFEKEKATLKLELANQLGTALIGILGNSLGAQLAGIALNAIIEIAKLKIATSAAQQINLANAVASAPPPLNALAIAAATTQNLALGASSKLKQTGIIASAAISGLGATLSNKKVKGFEDGLYPVTRSQDGKQFNAAFGGMTTSGLVNRPTVFMAGEQGKDRPEMIIDGDAYKRIDPTIKYALHREIARIKGYENGLYQQKTTQPTYIESNTSNQLSNELINSLAFMVQENTKVMKELKEAGIIATMTNKDLKAMKLIQDGIKDYNTLRDKNKV